MFTTKFNKFTCDGDTITCTVDGFDCVARIYRDDCADAPDQRQDGFWPSLNLANAGYIGAGKTQDDLHVALVQAHAIYNAWERDEWWYVGVVVAVSKNGIQLTGDFDHACWGIECNYPGSDNSYLSEVANEELGEALDAARTAVASLCS